MLILLFNTLITLKKKPHIFKINVIDELIVIGIETILPTNPKRYTIWIMSTDHQHRRRRVNRGVRNAPRGCHV